MKKKYLHPHVNGTFYLIEGLFEKVNTQTVGEAYIYETNLVVHGERSKTSEVMHSK